MATIDTLAPESDSHGGDAHDHDHPPWLAHHFDTPEQQFDSGKLGIWLFLVTEVLFFSGMFCAYAIFRMLRPDVFEGSSQFLNTKLGAINTGVLLFSSLTMAWAVRCAQTEEHKKLVALLASTLSCAMVFLGVKRSSIRTSGAWGSCRLECSFYDPANPHPTESQLVNVHGFSENAAYFITNSLFFLCLPFAIITVGVLVWAIVAKLGDNKFQFECAKPLFVVCLSFFAGVGLGTILESGGDAHASHDVAHHSDDHGGDEHASDHAVAAHEHGDHQHDADDGHDHGHDGHDEHGHDDHGHAEGAAELVAVPGELAAVELLAANETNTGAKAMLAASQTQTQFSDGQVVANASDSDSGVEAVGGNVLTKRQAGVFFGIYYCMTGVHAIHILAGIGVLVWLLVRAVRMDFNRQYFGPVDYVGLYWHIVDLIWIYLFPLLYLIR